MAGKKAGMRKSPKVNLNTKKNQLLTKIEEEMSHVRGIRSEKQILLELEELKASLQSKNLPRTSPHLFLEAKKKTLARFTQQIDNEFRRNERKYIIRMLLAFTPKSIMYMCIYFLTISQQNLQNHLIFIYYRQYLY